MLGKHTKHAIIGGSVILVLCFGGAVYLNDRPAHHANTRTERVDKGGQKTPKLRSTGHNHYHSTGEE